MGNSDIVRLCKTAFNQNEIHALFALYYRCGGFLFLRVVVVVNICAHFLAHR